MKKIVLIIAVLMLCLCACSPAVKDVALKDVSEKIMSDVGLEDPFDIGSEWVANTYGVKVEDIKQCAAVVNMVGIFPDEAVMFEAIDSAAADRLAARCESRLNDLKSQAENYDPESYATFKKCKVVRKGNYVAVFISAKTEEMQRIFEEAFK